MAAAVVVAIAMRVVAAAVIVSRTAKVGARWRRAVVGALAMIVITAAFGVMMIAIVVAIFFRIAFVIILAVVSIFPSLNLPPAGAGRWIPVAGDAERGRSVVAGIRIVVWAVRHARWQQKRGCRAKRYPKEAEASFHWAVLWTNATKVDSNYLADRLK